MSEIILCPYGSDAREEWNATALRARQRSFLFHRSYMDYHSDRFSDCSLIFRNAKDRPVALFPACTTPDEPHCVASHGGLTYGGFLTLPEVTAEVMECLWEQTLAYYRSHGMASLLYKAVPYIYHTYPSDEDLYFLFRQGAQLCARAVSSAVDLRSPYPFQSLRARKVRRAQREGGLHFSADPSLLPQYHTLLSEVLQQRHRTRPVHSLNELSLLFSRFPENIQLLSALTDGAEMLAGCVLFVTERVVHVQYIATGERGRAVGALDWLFSEMFRYVRTHCPHARYLDFGISTEQGGTCLNHGLIFQKEGFGARAVCYDQYEIKL